jgi:hypothetical protein
VSLETQVSRREVAIESFPTRNEAAIDKQKKTDQHEDLTGR